MKRVLIASFIILFPLIPIAPGLFDQSQGFYVDWWTNIWNIEYHARYFSVHHSMPDVIHTWNPERGIGRPDPLFYGFLFYPIMALIAQLLGTNLSLRLGIIVLWILQFVALKKVFLRLTDNYYLVYCVTALFLWGIYPLTNLYNRSALTEFFATGLLLCALCYFFLFLWSNLKREKINNAVFFGIFLTLCIGTHPITALYGGTFLFIVMVFSIGRLAKEISNNLPLILIIIVLCILTVLPWLYVTFKYMADLSISSSPSVSVYSQTIDWPLSRFLHFPMDKRSLIHGWDVPGLTPWLEAQMNMPLLILLAWKLFRMKRRIWSLKLHEKIYIVYPIILFLLTTLMSFSPWIWQFIPTIYKNIQMSYRMVTYQNLSLVLGLVSVFSLQKRLVPTRLFVVSKKTLVVTTICLSISFVAALEKLLHSSAIMGDINFPSSDRSKEFLATGWTAGIKGYVLSSVPKIDEEFSQELVFLPDPFKSGVKTVEEKRIFTDKPIWVKTNIQAFPWNKISDNSIEIPFTHFKQSGGMIVFHLDAGNHMINYNYSVNSFYVRLRMVSFTIITIWLATSFLLSIQSFLKNMSNKF